MLRHTFCHIPGIGEKTERRLWDNGVTSWEEALRQGCTRLTPEHLRDSLASYDRREAAWFGARLNAAQAWRLYHDFRDACVFLDIETTGMGPWADITTIALYDGRQVRHYVRGQNLDDFVRDVAAYRLLVTYNGKSFDVPFLERTFGVRLDQGHIDLRYVLRSLGLRGGLKACERQVGMTRPGLEEVDGYVAVLLWHDYHGRRNPLALQTLLAYNVQDVINLEPLMVQAFNRKLAQLGAAPFAAGYVLEMPAPAANPFQADAATVRRLVGAFPVPRPNLPHGPASLG
jgi:uncharacterized protein YprB with RNaseH-like and TPR domain